MRESPTVTNLDEDLDDLGTMLPFKLYTQICFCFLHDDEKLDLAIVNTLKKGLERLSAGFPWLTGQVILKNFDECIYKIKPLDRVPRLVVKDLRHDPSVPTMDSIRQAGFPSSMLHESIIAPCPTVPGADDNPAPVFLLQANFITGGLLLTISAQHNTMDMVGQGQIMHLFSKACHNEQFTSRELATGNLSRRNLIPVIEGSYEQNPELAHQIPGPSSSHPLSDDPSASSARYVAPKSTWAYFTFPVASLAALKTLASKTIVPPATYVSTDDALSAFIWQSVVGVRRSRLSSTTETIFSRAVDTRRYLDIPQTYPGAMQNMTYHTYPLQRLVDEPLGAVASQLRSAVDPKTSNLAYNTRALATFLNRAPSIRKAASFGRTLNLSTDFMLTSWVSITCYDLDFNLGLGKPECVRMPTFEPVEGVIYFMPRAPDGEIAVAFCLRDEDMERLRADEGFAMYAKYIG